jgi:hypothetical protein
MLCREMRLGNSNFSFLRKVIVVLDLHNKPYKKTRFDRSDRFEAKKLLHRSLTAAPPKRVPIPDSPMSSLGRTAARAFPDLEWAALKLALLRIAIEPRLWLARAGAEVRSGNAGD